MNQIDLKLDARKVVDVRGALYDSLDPEFLREDLIEIDLRSGYTIEAGWIPQGDPSGHFRVIVFEDYWTNTLFEGRAESPDEVVSLVHWLVSNFGSAPFHNLVYSQPDSFPQVVDIHEAMLA
jgi:hypothetical protein